MLVAVLCGGTPARAEDRPAAKPAESDTEARLRKLEERYEAMERKHAEAYDALLSKYKALEAKVRQGEATNAEKDGSVRRGAQEADRPTPNPPAPGLPPFDDPGTGEGAADLPDERPRASTGPSRTSDKRKPLDARFGRGFELETDDEEFQFQFHMLTNVDYRYYTQPNQDPVHSSFSFPRERLYFTGRLTKPIEYYFTINRAFGTLDLFDAFVNFHYDDRFQVKVGRFKTPYSYEFYALSAPYFITPERSLFASNFTPNREMGLMAWGQMFEKRFDYAVGMFNGNRFSFQDTNDPKDVIAYVNARPFEKASERWDVLRYLNFGGSLAYGNEYNNPAQPSVLRTSIAASNSTDAVNIAPPFLTFDKTVFQSGMRSLWDLHLAYFRGPLSVLAEWNVGYDTYRKDLKSPRTPIALDGYYATVGYFLTGETQTYRGTVTPKRPFKPGKADGGPGAIEAFARYSALRMGDSVFQAGLADRKLWTNQLYTVDVGVNWYLNEWVKIVGAWEHAEFATPVYYRPGGRQLTSDLFWFRVQTYF